MGSSIRLRRPGPARKTTTPSTNCVGAHWTIEAIRHPMPASSMPSASRGSSSSVRCWRSTKPRRQRRARSCRRWWKGRRRAPRRPAGCNPSPTLMCTARSWRRLTRKASRRSSRASAPRSAAVTRNRSMQTAPSGSTRAWPACASSPARIGRSHLRRALDGILPQRQPNSHGRRSPPATASQSSTSTHVHPMPTDHGCSTRRMHVRSISSATSRFSSTPRTASN